MTIRQDHLQDALSHLRDFISDIYIYPEVGSTNDRALSLARTDAIEGTLVVADHQLKGKGRNGNTWVSEIGVNLMFSLILRPDCLPNALTLLSLLSALSVAEALKKHTDRSFEIKWPNDVLLDGKKICGILNESAIMGQQAAYIVIGIGCNINQTDFDPNLQHLATSLKASTGKRYDRVAILADILTRLSVHYTQFLEGKTRESLQLWKNYCKMLGRAIHFKYEGQTQQGVAEDIDEQGFLIVMQSKRTLLLSQAEISTIRY